MAKATVIITTFRRTIFLKRAVQSALAQTVPAEVIIVDDNGLGTPDQIGTEQMLQENFGGCIIYLPLERNKGACVARNNGVEKAKGEFIFFLDDDDEFLPNKVESQVKYLEEHPKYDGCLSAFVRKDENGKLIEAQSNYPTTGTFSNFAVQGNFFTPMLCIRKTSFIKSGGFRNIPRFQDRYFMLHSLLQDKKFADLPEALYIMYEHSGVRVTHMSADQSLASLKQIDKLVNDNNERLSREEKIRFMEKSLRMKATIYYVAGIRKMAALRWWQIFQQTGSFGDLIMVLKSLFQK